MAPPLRVVVAVVAVLLAVLVLALAERLPVLLPEVAEVLAHLAHKLLPLVRLQVAEVLAARPVPLPQQPEVAAAVVLVQGLVASEILRSR